MGASAGLAAILFSTTGCLTLHVAQYLANLPDGSIHQSQRMCQRATASAEAARALPLGRRWPATRAGDLPKCG